MLSRAASASINSQANKSRLPEDMDLVSHPMLMLFHVRHSDRAGLIRPLKINADGGPSEVKVSRERQRLLDMNL